MLRELNVYSVEHFTHTSYRTCRTKLILHVIFVHCHSHTGQYLFFFSICDDGPGTHLTFFSSDGAMYMYMMRANQPQWIQRQSDGQWSKYYTQPTIENLLWLRFGALCVWAEQQLAGFYREHSNVSDVRMLDLLLYMHRIHFGDVYLWAGPSDNHRTPFRHNNLTLCAKRMLSIATQFRKARHFYEIFHLFFLLLLRLIAMGTWNGCVGHYHSTYNTQR